ncbi:MAG: cation:proton antiporter [Verrucomicrobia bacterium]|nr:cation:proton antiporter [Verrucomicrobiota bacterium]
MKRSVVIYAVVLLVFGLGIWLILQQGRGLEVQPASDSPAGQALLPALAGQAASEESLPRSLWSGVKENLRHPLSRLFIQLILIMLTARGVGSLFTKAGQPAVIGEMVAGILLGPSLLGWLWPGAFDAIFPAPTLGTLRILSQIGVCLFLFVVGMDLDVDHLRHRAQTAVVVSHVSIVFPCFLGVAVSLFLYSKLAAPGATFAAFALFMGIAMSITAFPVLARIIEERRLSKTALGSTAITCAAVDDVTAWSLLALVVAAVQAGGLASAVLSIVLVVAFVAVMLFGVKPRLARWIETAKVNGAGPGKGVMAAVLAFVLASAFVTEVAGIHALFGAFLAGVVMPRESEFCHYLRVRIENMSSVFLLPLFFAFTGLRTQVTLLNDAESWLICAGLICVATVGKLGGSMLAARCTGLGWNEAFALGALMNTRGLMELIALNIGYDLGILSPRIFTMMVLMALVTTFLTGPLLALGERWKVKPTLSAGVCSTT